jgi:hypothetical protein
MMEMKKILAVGIIFLFIGIAVAPTTNFTIVKASGDNDTVEVTTQACGIKGYGNTTVKLTREQYQNLESYLVEFRARLNQTSTKEEAVPIFKEAVVELDKYGLLPKGMSVEQAQKLVIGNRQNKNLMNLHRKINIKSLSRNNENFICLIVGLTSNTGFQSVASHCLGTLASLMWFLPFGILVNLYILSIIINMFNPFSLIQRIGIGAYDPDVGGFSPAYGWIFTTGLLGIKKWNGVMSGELKIGDVEGMFGSYSSAVSGFTGLKILNIINYGFGYFYIGTALDVKISLS